MDNDRPLAERVARLEAALAQLTTRYERPKETSMDDDDDCGVISPLGAHWALCGEMWERSDPKPPATWAANDPAPPDGTIVADDHLAPWILEDGIWRCATPHRVVTTKLSGLTRRCTVLRWGWNK